MSENDGGPAFPGGGYIGHGMSLRDYFAAKAMQGLIASRNESGPFRSTRWLFDDAKYCYDIADALLAEREKDDG